MAKYGEKQTKELLERVFRLIADSHFGDHAASITYCQQMRFNRSLGEDIANFIQAKSPEVYHREKRYFEQAQKETQC